MDQHYSGPVITLVNSIIGVSILAMPYCFKQCGIILAILILLTSNLLTRVTCHFLLKSATVSRRRTFEYLAFHTFGNLGKFSIEIGMIGYLIGTCIAFFVVMGDLGPEIISEITSTETSSTMRTSILMALALFCVLPLGLLRNVDSLIGVSKATIGFYVCLVLKIFLEALPHLYRGDWFVTVDLWKPSGLLQVLPIISMALFCQTQLFEIYQTIEHPTLEKLNQVVKSAVNICTAVYFFVGLFGYVAFSQKKFGGNILLSFAPSFVTNAMKLGFILSLAFSFPLVIFPCRQSLYSLLFREGYHLHESASNYIPEGKFKGITLFIVFTSLVVSILIPTIEVVLGLIGSTIGVMICLIFPVTCFICISHKDNNERLLAKFVLILGIFIMVLGTYANIRTLEKIESPTIQNSKNVIAANFEPEMREIKISNQEMTTFFNIKTQANISKVTDNHEVRHEPPQPIETMEDPKKKEILIGTKPSNGVKNAKKENTQANIDHELPAAGQHMPIIPDVPQIMPALNLSKNSQVKNQDDQVDPEAIKKDDNEMNLEVKDSKKAKHDVEEDHKILLETIQHQQEVQDDLVRQQKKLIEVIEKEHLIKEQEKIKNAEKIKAVKKIENLVIEAIEKISGGEKAEDKEAPQNQVQREHNKEPLPPVKDNFKSPGEIQLNQEHKTNLETEDKQNKSNILAKKREQNDEIRVKELNIVEETKQKLENLSLEKVNLKNKDIENGQHENENSSNQEKAPSELKIVEETKRKLEEIVNDAKHVNLETQNKENKNEQSDNKNDVKQDNHNREELPNSQLKSNELNIIEETKQKLEKIIGNVKKVDVEMSDTNSQQRENKTVQPGKTIFSDKIKSNKESVADLNQSDILKNKQPAPAPLFKNLGQADPKTNQIAVEKTEEHAVPVAVRVMNASSNFTIEDILKDNKKDSENVKMEDEVKVLRRDILSYSITNTKRK